MSVSAKTLIPSGYAANSLTTEYTAPTATTAIIDKFTATNTDAGAQTISIHIVSSGGSADNTNLIIQTQSLAAAETYDFTEIKNHILDTGDFISVVSSVASKMVIRASGREVV